MVTLVILLDIWHRKQTLRFDRFTIIDRDRLTGGKTNWSVFQALHSNIFLLYWLSISIYRSYQIINFFFLPLIRIITEKNKGAIERSSQSIEKRVLIKNNRMTIKENALSVVLIEITKEIKLMNESAEGRFCRMK